MTWLDFESLLCCQSSTDMLSGWMELCFNSLEAAWGHQERGHPEEHAQSWGWSTGCSLAFQHSWIQQEPMIPPILPQTSLCLVLGFTNAKYPNVLNKRCKSLSSGRLCKNRYKGALAGLGHCSNAGTWGWIMYLWGLLLPSAWWGSLTTGLWPPYRMHLPSRVPASHTHAMVASMMAASDTQPPLPFLRPPDILFHSNNCSLTLQSPI